MKISTDSITLAEFVNAVAYHGAELYLMECEEAIVFDRTAQIVYIPVTTHQTAALNPMGDFKTRLGHGLLWSRHVEINCNSEQLRGAVLGAGYGLTVSQGNGVFTIYAMEQAGDAAIGA
ncbi:MAG: hypothetical protein LBN30_08295 [Oscillospiraceae bacterium]|jgi:hypothetical protein|nr:hypothetical protein [Oscillospiraceae bacterium]